MIYSLMRVMHVYIHMSSLHLYNMAIQSTQHAQRFERPKNDSKSRPHCYTLEFISCEYMGWETSCCWGDVKMAGMWQLVPVWQCHPSPMPETAVMTRDGGFSRSNKSGGRVEMTYTCIHLCYFYQILPCGILRNTAFFNMVDPTYLLKNSSYSIFGIHFNKCMLCFLEEALSLAISYCTLPLLDTCFSNGLFSLGWKLYIVKSI